MSVIKKADVPAHFAARRARRRAEALFMSQPAATGDLQVKVTGTKAEAQEFVEDFSLEHSSFSAPATPDAKTLKSDRGQASA